MSSEILSPVTTPGLLYPALYGVKPRGKDYRCPKCQSTNRTKVTGITYIPKEPFQRALDEWRKWVFQQGVVGYHKDPSTQEIEGWHFQCGWCGTEWEASAKLILNEILEEQIKRVANFTKETGKEFGALIVRTEDGLRLDMIDIGEDRSVELVPTHELQEDEELLGTWHCVFPTSLVETDKGRKFICKIQKGDNVLTEDGQYHTVLETKKRKYTGDVITISIYNGYRLTLTPEHLVLTTLGSEKIWKQAEKLTVYDHVLVPEYMFDKCQVCNSPIPYGRKFCSTSCMGKFQANDPTFKEKVRVGCIKRSANPKYHEKLSIAMKKAIKEGRKIVPEGFRNEETESKAWDTLRRGGDTGSYWEIRLKQILEYYYPDKEFIRNYEVLGKEYVICNQFGQTKGKKHRQYFLDIAIPKEKIDIEVDGKAFHTDLEHDKQRDEFLISEGWTVRRIPVEKVANGTFWEILKNIFVIPVFEDPPINFIPVKIQKIIRRTIKNRAVWNLEVDGVPSFVAGRMVVHNCHPISDKPSFYDIGTFLRDPWERISCVSGAHGNLTVMVKLPETTLLKPEELKSWEKENRELETPLKILGEKYKFLVYQGLPGSLKSLTGEESTTTLESLVEGVRGRKDV